MENINNNIITPYQRRQNKLFIIKIIFILISYQIFFALPINIILIFLWNYFALFSDLIFFFSRFLLIIDITTTIPFTSWEISSLLFTFLVHLLNIIIYLLYLIPVFRYIYNGENPEKAKKHMFGGFSMLYLSGAFLMLLCFGTLYVRPEVANKGVDWSYIINDNIFILIYWFVLTLLYTFLCRIITMPVREKLNIKHMSKNDLSFFDNVMGFFPVASVCGSFIVFFKRVLDFLLYYADMNDARIPSLMSQFIWILALFFVFMMITVLLVAAIQFMEGKTLYPLQNQFVSLSKGGADLTHRFNINSEGIWGIITSNFNLFLEKFQRQIIRLKQAANEILKGTESLTNNFNIIAQSTKIQNEELAPLSNSVDSIALGMRSLISDVREKYNYTSSNLQYIDNISNGIEKIIQLFQSIKKQSSHSLSTANMVMRQIQESLEKSTQMNQAMTLISKKIQDAGREAEYIDEILVLIQDVSEQTNILSINAAIEAAHAGDAGKGFAIVANEVRTLATESGKAVEHISRKLVDIQQIIRSSVEMTVFAEQVTNENSILVNETYQVIQKMIEQFQKLGNITDSASVITAQQGTITRNFRNQVRVLMLFFENLRDSMISQESSFDDLTLTVKILRESFEEIRIFNEKVHQSVQEVAKTEQILTNTVSVFKVE